MFFLPLGLANRLPVIPWAVLLLMATNFMLSYNEVSIFKKQEAKFLRPFTRPLVEAQLDVIHDVCDLRVKDAGICGELQNKIMGKLHRRGEISNHDYAQLQKKYNGSIREPAAEKDEDSVSLLGELKKIGQLNEIVTSLMEDPKHVKDPAITRLKSYGRLLAELDLIHKASAENAKKMNFLTASNLTVLTLTRAQFQHLNWSHLLGNLLFLFIFGAFVEARMGIAAFVITYFAAGYAGLFSQIMFDGLNGSYLMGASANIMGIVGAFAVLFRHHRMRVWLCLMMVYNRLLQLPVLGVVGVCVVAGDLIGVVGQSSGVAHFAHLSGLAVGAGCAWIFTLLSPLPENLLYEQEWDLLRKLKEATAWDEVKQLCTRLLRWNPNNVLVMFEGLKVGLRDEPNRLAGGIKFAKSFFTPALAILIRTGRFKEALKVFHCVPYGCKAGDFLVRLQPMAGLHLAKYALTVNDWQTAIRLYDWAFNQSNNPKMKHSISQSLTALAVHLGNAEPGLENIISQLGISTPTQHLFIRKAS